MRPNTNGFWLVEDGVEVPIDEDELPIVLRLSKMLRARIELRAPDKPTIDLGTVAQFRRKCFILSIAYR